MNMPADVIETAPPAYCKDWAASTNDLKKHDDTSSAVVASVPVPPSYSATTQITDEDLLELAIADAGHHVSLDQHPFCIRPESRINPSAQELYRRLNKEPKRTRQPLILLNWNFSDAIPTQDLLLRAFFSAISRGADDIIDRVLDTGLLDANTPAVGIDTGLTPLLCAIQHHQNHLVPLLISHGARVDDFGTYRSWSKQRFIGYADFPTKTSERSVRTPLQLAASLGNLTIVKALFERYSADDSLVAPDGQIALRLAAQNRHSEIVAFLPARRGGGYLRWKTKHHQTVKRIKKSGIQLYKIGKTIVYEIPRCIINGLLFGAKRTVLKAWKARRQILLSCLNLPQKCWKALRKAPEALKDLVVDLSRFIVKLVTVYIPEGIKLLGRVSKMIGVSIWKGVVRILNRTISFIHTLIAAIVSAFRWITWENICHGFKDILHAIFVAFPKILWKTLRKIEHLLSKLPSTLIQIILILVWVIRELVMAIVKPVWKIFTSIFGTIGAGGKEIQVYFNPKA